MGATEPTEKLTTPTSPRSRASPRSQTSPRTPASPRSPRSSKDEARTEAPEDTHEEVQATLRALLDEVQTTFRPFEETIFTKIDAMQEKINALDSSVANLSIAKPVDISSDSAHGEGPSNGAPPDVAP